MDKSMSKEDAILWIKNIINDIGSPRHSDLWGYEEALYEIQKLLKEDSAQQWIPCSERLPEEFGDYLVSVKRHGWNCEEHIENDIAYWDDLEGFHKVDEVLAWMPLPDCYQGENAND